jgi:hypothetical protein
LGRFFEILAKKATTKQNYIINLLKTKKMETTNEKNYSRQLGKFIDSTPFASSVYCQTNWQTWVSYYKDNDGLIHSSSFNYSIVKCEPVTEEEFKKLIEKNPRAKVSFV